VAALFTAWLVASCAYGGAPTSPRQEAFGRETSVGSAEIDAAAHLYLDPGETRSAGAPSTFSSGAADLNDDGYVDAVVVQEACERDGCEVLVLGGTEDGLVLVSKDTVPTYRVSASRHTTNGWRDLIVSSDSTPRAKYSVLRFDGLGYVKDDSDEEPLDANSPVIKDGMILLEVRRVDQTIGRKEGSAHGG
jgi:hypothetical protein